MKLHLESVSPELLETLQGLMEMELLAPAALGGKTSLAESLDFFCAWYGTAGRFLAIRSLNWFGDTEAEPDPIYLNGWTWPLVRQRMATLARALIQ